MATQRPTQVNIRLPREIFEKLEAAAFVNDATPTTLVTEVAEEAIDEWALEPLIKEAIEVRKKANAAKASKVRPLFAKGGDKPKSR